MQLTKQQDELRNTEDLSPFSSTTENIFSTVSPQHVDNDGMFPTP